jgi:alkanesulfonate monooxygenase SsuD/methylene tetrahydromethanopterin reductase-like flavin-dependent oxidoreductase (luciferase family)
VWQSGHVLPPSATGEAVIRLALMTAWTERVRVGTSVLLLPLYHPVVLAKQLADLDSRSGGRLTVGVGVGGEFPAEFDAVGVTVAERGARTSESIEVLRKLWRGGDRRARGPRGTAKAGDPMSDPLAGLAVAV